MDKVVAIAGKVLEIMLGFFVASLTLLCIWQVVGRYFFQQPTMVEEELARFGLVWTAFCGSTLAFARGEQLSFTLLHEIFERKSPQVVFVLKIAVNIVILGVLFGVMVVGGWTLVRSNMNQLTPVLQMKKGLIYLIIPIAGLLSVFFQAVIFAKVLRLGVKHDTSH